MTLGKGQPARYVAMEDLIPIGQFAAASRLSLKALRLYDENGLLRPAHLDPESGYRSYRLGQLRSATLIGLLRSAGMPLVEIRGVLGDPSVARIDEYEATRDKTLPAGEVAYTVAIGEQTIFPEIIGAYDAVAGWAKANTGARGTAARDLPRRGHD